MLVILPLTRSRFARHINHVRGKLKSGIEACALYGRRGDCDRPVQVARGDEEDVYGRSEVGIRRIQYTTARTIAPYLPDARFRAQIFASDSTHSELVGTSAKL